jgi:hypothetical protein
VGGAIGHPSRNLNAQGGSASVWGAVAAATWRARPRDGELLLCATGFLDFTRNDPLMRTAEVKQKPIACQFGHVLQCPRLLEQVRRAGNNLQLHFAAHLVARHFV